MTGHTLDQCNAPGIAGPCILPLGHDDSFHKDAVGKYWIVEAAAPTLLQGSPTAGSNPLAGDLVGRLTAALLAEPWNSWPKSAHGEHRFDSGCAICQCDVVRLAAFVVRFMEPEVLAAEVDRFHQQGERADAARECPAWAWHACACPQQCDPEPASLPRPDTDQQDGEAFTAAVEAGNHDEPLGAWERELLKSKDRETADCGDEHPETGRRCTRPAGHDTHRNGGVGWTYLRDDTIDALSQRAGRAERQRDGFYAELKDAERTLAAVEQICRAATIPPVAELEARLAGRILARIEQPAGSSKRCPSCDHRADLHHPDGCWHTVTQGAAGRDLVCPCTVARAELNQPEAAPDGR